MHIPKTAGLAFRETLYGQYGKRHVLAVNHIDLRNEQQQLRDHYRKRHRVIHGHLFYHQLRPFQGPGTRLVTWLREPVRRVVSNYYYSITQEFPKRQALDPSLRQLSLREFAERPRRRNVMSAYLEGIDLEELFFFGLQEHYAEDLSRLGNRLGWALPPEAGQRRINAKTQYTPPDAATLDYIRQLNQEDMALYERAARLRKQQIG